MHTDEQVLDAVLSFETMTVAAHELGMTKEAISSRVRRMRSYGVFVPQSQDKRGRWRRYTPERVKELNDYIQQHTRHS